MRRWETLRAEVLSNSNAGPAKKEIQELPYLAGVVKEGLRLSMANPTRLPHVVPDEGWDFKGTFFPAGSIVGCSAYELHFNSTAYPNPYVFLPERWLEGNVTAEANKHFYAFGVGSRSCIARNLATVELFMATEKLAEADTLRGARACQDEIEIYEWFNASVKGEKIELVWEKKAVDA
jgi:cytochrome P450